MSIVGRTLGRCTGPPGVIYRTYPHFSSFRAFAVANGVVQYSLATHFLLTANFDTDTTGCVAYTKLSVEPVFCVLSNATVW